MLAASKDKILIKGERVYLRILKESDASEEYCSWLNDTDTNRYLETKSATIGSLRNYIKDKYNDPNCLFFGIFLCDSQKHIGNVKLEPIDFKNKMATLGILIGNKSYQGRGVGPETLTLLVRWAFDCLGLNEIGLGVIAENERAVRAYEKCGFKISSIEKKKREDGTSFNHIEMFIRK